MISLQRLCLIA